jgi:hypothetical protein
VTLDQDDIEAIAHRVAKLLNQSPALVRLVDAATLARVLGVERDWIYAHANQLGAIRLGGSTGRLRFDPNHALHALRGPPERVASGPARRPQRRRGPKEVRGLELIAYES